MTTISEIRTKVHIYLSETIKPFSPFGENLVNLRKKLAEYKKELAERDYRYFRRELGIQLFSRRDLHFGAQVIRGKQLSTCLPGVMHLESTVDFSDALFAEFALTDAEKSTIEQLISGSHLAEIPDAKLTNNTISCACELYPLSTLMWIKENKEKWITTRFLSRLAIRTALGINPLDIEQFCVPEISKVFDSDLCPLFQTIIYRIARINGFFYTKRYEKFMEIPLATVEDEKRRTENIVTYL